jgi:hypothetical protein
LLQYLTLPGKKGQMAGLFAASVAQTLPKLAVPSIRPSTQLLAFSPSNRPRKKIS